MDPEESLSYEEIAKIAASVAVAETIKTMEEKWAEREKSSKITDFITLNYC